MNITQSLPVMHGKAVASWGSRQERPGERLKIVPPLLPANLAQIQAGTAHWHGV